MIRPTPKSTLFPYTTLFRSHTSVLTVCGFAYTPTFMLELLYHLVAPASLLRHSISHLGGTGISTCCPSATLFSLTLGPRSEEHTSELQSRPHLVCRLLLEKK